MFVDKILIDIPQLFEQDLPCQDHLRIFCPDLQEAVFQRRERQRIPCKFRGHPREIDRQDTVIVTVPAGLSDDPVQQRRQFLLKDTHMKRLCHIVVRPQLITPEHIALHIICSQKDHGSIRPAPPDLPTEIKTAPVRQVHVKHDQVIIPILQKLPRRPLNKPHVNSPFLTITAYNLITDPFSNIRTINSGIIKFMKKNIIRRMLNKTKKSIVFVQIYVHYISRIQFFRIMMF